MKRIGQLSHVGFGSRLVVSAGVLSVLISISPTTAAAPARPLSSVQQRYLSVAEHGTSQTMRWRNASRRWYKAVLNDRRPFPLAPVWDVFPLWESTTDVALAAPSASHRAAVVRIGDYAKTYWDPKLMPGPGYIPYPKTSPSGDRASRE